MLVEHGSPSKSRAVTIERFLVFTDSSLYRLESVGSGLHILGKIGGLDGLMQNPIADLYCKLHNTSNQCSSSAPLMQLN